jgi:hypothetical protein
MNVCKAHKSRPSALIEASSCFSAFGWLAESFYMDRNI